ncbi:ATP-binding cassette domain-containing protein [Nonomuraea thailandensis]
MARAGLQVELARDSFAAVVTTVRGFVFTVVSVVLGLLTLAPETLVLVMPPFLAGLGLFLASLPALARRQRAYLLADEHLAEAMIGMAGGLRDIEACGLRESVTGRLERRVGAQAAAARTLARVSAARTAALAAGGWLPVVLVLAGTPWLLERGVGAGVIVGTLAYVAQSLAPALGGLVQGLGVSGVRLAVSLGRILAMAPPAAPDPPRIRPITSEIRLDAVTFAYGPHSAPVVRGLDLTVPEGDHLAIVGPSGAGKSTLASLLSGVLRPGKGEVLIGGVPADRLDPAARVLIPQEAYVFRGTLRENLLYHAETGAALAEAVEAVGAGGLVEELGGYDAQVEPGALSAGRRQLIALARAYLAPATLVILDEATCHLDPATEARAEAAFARRGGTLVVIAHRLTSALRARRILLMDGARITLGTHEELIRTSPCTPTWPATGTRSPSHEIPARRTPPLTDRSHGHEIDDPYRWLEDPLDPRTQAWLAAQDRLWRDSAAGLSQRERFLARLTELRDTGLVTPPVWRGDQRFHLRRSPSQEHPVLCCDDRVVLDPMELDPSGLTTLDGWQPDLEGRRLAYQISRSGDEKACLYVRDLATGEVVDGPIGGCRYSAVAWLPGGGAFYYVRFQQGVFLHTIGSAEADVPVFTRGAISYGVQISPDGRWLTISAGTASGNSLWLADLAGEDPAPRPVQEGSPARTAGAVAGDGRLYLLTDRDAPRRRLCVADPRTPTAWRELIPEDEEAVLGAFTLLDGDRLLVSRTRHAVGEIAVHDARTGSG